MDRSEEHTLVPVDPAERAGHLVGRRLLYRSTTLVIATILGFAVLDGVDVVDSYGVDVVTARATSPDGHVLEVDHASVTRPALASPLRITVRGVSDGETVTIGIERAYLAIWDHNAVFPAPADERSVEPWVVWEFEATGGPLVVEIDGRLEPAVQSGRTGHVVLLDESDEPYVAVELHTRVMP